MKTENPIERGVDQTLKAEGFVRKGDVWVRDCAEALLLVRLQKSNFGAQYYLGLGVYLKGLGGPEIAAKSLKEPNCHIRIRAESLAVDSWKSVFDLDDEAMDPIQRETRVSALLRATALPWLFICSTRAGLRTAEREGRLASALVDKRVRDQLS